MPDGTSPDFASQADESTCWPAGLVGPRLRQSEFRFTDRGAVLQAGDTISYSPAESHSCGDPADAAPAAALFFQIPAKH